MMTDWDRKFSNREHVGWDVFEATIARWNDDASSFRDKMAREGRCELDVSYGGEPRNLCDFYLAEGTAKGTVIFVHGGYWRSLDKSVFSHFATGPLANGWNVAMPSYTLSPQAEIADISREIAAAITMTARRETGRIRLSGHSAGGHLSARQHCDDRLIPDAVFERIERTVAISGVFDLRDLRHTEMNADFRLDEKKGALESPALLTPRPGADIRCIVGGGELPEFIRQNGLLAGWRDHGAQVDILESAGHNHFSVIEPLLEADSQLTQLICS